MQTKVNENLFEGQSFYIGIDSHKKSWSVTILGETYEHKTMSQNPNPEILSGYMHRNYPGGNYYAVYEAGFNGFGPARKLNELGIECSVVHPADVPTSHKEKLQKNDKVDSRKLSKMLRSKQFQGIHIPDEQLEADRLLLRQRFRMMKDLARTKNRVKSLLFQFGIDIPPQFTSAQTRHWSGKFINWLKELTFDHESIKLSLDNYILIGEQQRKDLLMINRQVRDLVQNVRYKHNYELLITIPGVGIITAMTFLLQVGNIDRFKSLDQLCSYLGLVPQTHSSGEKQRTGSLIKRGRKELKVMLIEASWDMMRMDPSMTAYFNELTKRMNKNKAIIRITRKLVARMRYMLMHQQEYKLNEA